MSNDSFKFTPTGDLITVNSGDGVLTAASLKYASTDYITIQRPKRYDFTPQDDITPLESAWCGHLFACMASPGYISMRGHQQWQLIKRHFTEVE